MYFWRRRQWPRGLRRGSAAARLLGSQVRIPLTAWTFVSCECFDRYRSLRREDHWLRHILPSVVCLSVIVKPRWGPSPHWAAAPRIKNIFFWVVTEANRIILQDNKSSRWDSKQGHLKEERWTPNNTPRRLGILRHVVFVRQTGIYRVLYCHNDITFILHNYGNWETYFGSSRQTQCVHF